jgi:hypothetical protein
MIKDRVGTVFKGVEITTKEPSTITLDEGEDANIQVSVLCEHDGRLRDSLMLDFVRRLNYSFIHLLCGGRPDRRLQNSSVRNCVCRLSQAEPPLQG